MWNCSILSGDKLMHGTVFDGSNAACSTSAK
jgi:hypothetical protein